MCSNLMTEMTKSSDELAILIIIAGKKRENYSRSKMSIFDLRTQQMWTETGYLGVPFFT